MATVEAPAITPDDLLAMEDAAHYELIDGYLVERNVSTDSSEVAANIIHELLAYVRPRRLGKVYPPDLGIRAFVARPDQVRRADVSFVRGENVPRESSGYLRVVPDLVVEVVSPGDTFREVRDKVDMWLDAGARAVWVVDPDKGEVIAYRGGSRPVILRMNDHIDGEDVIPGFRCPVASFFPAPLSAGPPPGQP